MMVIIVLMMMIYPYNFQGEYIGGSKDNNKGNIKDKEAQEKSLDWMEDLVHRLFKIINLIQCMESFSM